MNLANIDIMSHITKIAVVETSTSIWEYDPELPSNRVLGGSLDVIATVHTLAIKVCTSILILLANTYCTYINQIQSSGQHIESFERLQLECGITEPLKIPLHSNVRWGSAYFMLAHAYTLRHAINLFVASGDERFGSITTLRRDGRVVKHIPWSAFKLSGLESSAGCGSHSSGTFFLHTLPTRR